ncbi:MAG TPA: hypothetical protein V6D33_02030 [Cyanophyceae cyanobacterium]
MLNRGLKLFLSLPKRNQQIVIAVVLLLVSVGVSSIAISWQQQVRFVSARRVVDPSFLEMVIHENYAGSSQLEPKVVRRNGFLIFDFNSPELCGVAGCLYSAYVNGSHTSFYLKKVPQSIDLFTFEQHGAAQCFVTAQQGNKGIIETRYCHQQGQLAKVITELSDGK